MVPLSFLQKHYLGSKGEHKMRLTLVLLDLWGTAPSLHV